jgi:hypothetical protein
MAFGYDLQTTAGAPMTAQRNTPTALQPQREYLITDDDIKNIFVAIRDDSITQNDIDKLRNRPHTPAPTDEQCRICSDAIALTATLAAINKFIEFGKSSRCVKTGKEVSCDAICEHDCIVCFAESLRTAAQEARR